MKRFLTDILIFSVPFIIYLTIIYLIDPFSFTGENGLVSDSLKKDISYNVEPHLYTLIEYDNNPKPNIAIGDSRTKIIFYSPRMKNFANLSYGGASLQEMIQTFWYATEICDLDTVLMGIGLNLYNKYNRRFWVEETIERKKNFFAYAFNKYTYNAAYLIVNDLIFGEKTVLGKPPVSKEKWWDIQLGPNAQKYYSEFSLAENYYKELRKISEYCKENEIILIFWIPPSHLDYQMRTYDFGLQEEEIAFRKDLMSLGILFDFNYASDLTRNKDNFTDPLHYTDSICHIISIEILDLKPKFAKYYDDQK